MLELKESNVLTLNALMEGKTSLLEVVLKVPSDLSEEISTIAVYPKTSLQEASCVEIGDTSKRRCRLPLSEASMEARIILVSSVLDNEAVMKQVTMYLHSTVCEIIVLVSLASSDESGDAEESIEVLCNCLNDCDSAKKCDWIWDAFVALSKPVSEIERSDLSILGEQKLSLIEIVDAGTFGCFTTFGDLGGKLLRTDVGVDSVNVGVPNEVLFKEVTEIPSIGERRNESLDDSCLFVLWE